jgi:hypothetical protein
MTLLGPSEVMARRRPFVVLSMAALRLAAGFCLAFPLASLLGSSGVGAYADGDRVLFEGGGYLLLEVLRMQGPSLLALTRGLIPVLGVGLLLTALCNTALLVALNVKGRLELRSWLSHALERLPGVVVLGVGTTLGQVVLLGLGMTLISAVPDSMAKPVQTSLLELAGWLVVALGAGALGGLADVAKACFVRSQVGLAAALRQAFSCLSRRPFLATFGWLPYALLFAAGVAAAAWLSGGVDVSRPGRLRIAAVFVTHQLVILLGVALRAAWFARASRLAASAGSSV